jgi:galactose mutarotase-like enzyme
LPSFQATDSEAYVEARGGLESVRIVSPGGELAAEFVPAANLLCRSVTYRGIELLHHGRGVRAYAEQGQTMGIPLLHPWANRLAGPAYTAGGKRVELPAPDGRYGTDPNGLPIHGALPGLLRWEVEEGGHEDDRIAARLEWDGDVMFELFPFAHQLRVSARAADDELQLVTTLRPTGDDAVPVSFGYHPYLCLPEIPRRDWEVSLGASERLVTDERQIPTGRREPLADRSFRLDDSSWDDGLCGLSAPPVFTVSNGRLSLTVTFEAGYRFAQVYAPAGQDLICFEPMTAPTNALVDGRDLVLVAPGEEHRAAFSVAVAHEDGVTPATG